MADKGCGEFRRQLEYTAAKRGKTGAVVIRWDPSSNVFGLGV